MPQQITVAPGDSAVVVAAVSAGEWTDCHGHTHLVRSRVTWSSSNAAVATIAPLDSLRARITGVGRAQTTVIATAVDVPDYKGAAAVVVP
jgi:hypothetical protein